jgi:hypothetical protein
MRSKMEDNSLGETTDRPDGLETPGIQMEQPPQNPELAILASLQANMLPDVALQGWGLVVLGSVIIAHPEFNKPELFENVNFRELYMKGETAEIPKKYKLCCERVTSVEADTLIEQLAAVQASTAVILEVIMIREKQKIVADTLRMHVTLEDKGRLVFRIVYVEVLNNG